MKKSIILATVILAVSSFAFGEEVIRTVSVAPDGLSADQTFTKNGREIVTKTVYSTLSGIERMSSEDLYGEVPGLYDDDVKEYFANGKLKWQGHYTAGRLDGWMKEYYENGKPKKELFFKMGESGKLAKVYDEKGRLKAEMVKGESPDQYILKGYYKSGKLCRSQSYKRDWLDGASTRYFENGKPQLVELYKNQRLIKVETFDKKGNVLSSDTFDYPDNP